MKEFLKITFNLDPKNMLIDTQMHHLHDQKRQTVELPLSLKKICTVFFLKQKVNFSNTGNVKEGMQKYNQRDK